MEIRVEEHQQAQHEPFEAVREELAREILEGEATREVARALAEKIAASIREGRSLEQAARAEGLTLERSGWLDRQGEGFVRGLGAAQDLLATAFTLSPGESSPRIFEVGDKLALLQVLERQMPEEADAEGGVAIERGQLRNQKLTLMARSWINARRAALIESGDLAIDLSRIGRGR